MSRFLEIGEIIEAVSSPISVIANAAPIVAPSKGPNEKSSMQLVYIVGGIAVGLLIYYLYKKHKDENTDPRFKQ